MVEGFRIRDFDHVPSCEVAVPPLRIYHQRYAGELLNVRVPPPADQPSQVSVRPTVRAGSRGQGGADLGDSPPATRAAPTLAREGGGRVLVLAIVFAVSGFSALVCQVVWMRMLASVLGSTASATAALLAAFMGGLALGSWLSGRVLERFPRPLALFAACEVAIGLAAIASPTVSDAAATIYAGSAVLFGDWGLARTGMQFAVSVLCLLVPTTAMGATLPALVRAAVRPDDEARGLAILYGANTLGAALGALVAGFVLIPRYGLTASLVLAGSLSILNAMIAWRMARPVTPSNGRRTAAEIPGDVGREPGRIRRAVVITVVVAGFAGLASEVAWTRILVFGLGSTTYAFAAMLVTFLVGLAAGSFVAGRALPRLARPVAALAVIQAGVGIAGVASIMAYSRYAERLATTVFIASERSWSSGVQLDFAVAAMVLLPSTLLMGAAFPVACAAYHRASSPAASSLGRLYAANTLGAIAGSLAAAFVLIPLAGLQRTVLLLAAANFLCASLLALAEGVPHARVMRAGMPAVLAFSVLLLPIIRPFHQVGPTERLLFYDEGPMSTVSVVEDATGTRQLFIDKIAVAGTDLVLLTDQKSLAHVPMLLHPEAKRVLSVGFGSGGASWSFTRYGRLDRVDTVEIDPTVIKAAPFLAASHHGVLDHPKFHLISEDVRSHLLTTRVNYDIISTDCTDLRYKSNALLYTQKYFQLCRRRLNPGGIVAVWLPLGGLSTEALRVALSTFQSVFPHTNVWYMNNVPAHYALLIGSERAIAFDAAGIARQLAEPDVQADLAEIGLGHVWKLFGTFVTDATGSRRLAADARINTDDQPILEFMVPRTGFKGSITANLHALLDERRPPELVGADRREAEAAARYWAAGGELDRGHAVFLRGNYEYGKAIARYQSASALNPHDTDIARLIGRVEATAAAKMTELQAVLASAPANVRARNDMGLLWLSRGDTDAALQEFRAAAALQPRDWTARFNLGLAHERRGDPQAAATAYREALARDDSVAAIHTNLGLLLLSQGATPEALDRLRRAADLEPRSADAIFNLGLAYQRAGQDADALASYDEAIRRQGSHAAALTNRGSIHLAMGRPDEARRGFNLAVAAEPSYAEAHYNLGLLLDREGRVQEAAAAYQTVLRFSPNHADARNNLGILSDRAGDVAGAIAHYRVAIAARPDYAAAHTNLALALLRAGRVEEARIEAEHAVRLSPGVAQAHVSLGLASWRSGDRPRAEAAFVQALAIDPSLETVRRWLQTLRGGG